MRKREREEGERIEGETRKEENATGVEEDNKRVTSGEWKKVEKRFARKVGGTITSFFFSNIPENHEEKHMWAIFQWWGKIKDLFIVRKKTKNGKRYSFVHFVGVLEPKDLEQSLDCIFTRINKLFVNFPKFERVSPTKGEVKRW